MDQATRRLVVASRCLLTSRLSCCRFIHSSRSLTSQTSSSTDNKAPYDDDQQPEEELQQPLYSSHIVTSPIQKLVLAFGSSVMSLADPWRHDMIAVSGETTGTFALQQMLRKMRQSREGNEILTEKPSISTQTVDFNKLMQLPVSSFGHRYASFMKENGISPDTRDPVKFVDDVELAYVMKRYREVHDLIHCICGMRTNMLGEVSIKWVEAIQTNLPMTWGAAFLGPIRLAPGQRRRYVSTHLPWALKCGHEAQFLYNVYFEKRWSQDLTDLRNELRIPDPPAE